MIIAVLLCVQLGYATPPLAYDTCDVTNPVNAAFHRMQLDTLQNGRDEGNVWIQDVAVIADVPVSETATQWLEIAGFQFFQDNVYWQEGCRFNETQVWPVYDPVANETVYEVQRVFIYPKAPHYRADFSVFPPHLEKAQADYDVEWHKNAYVENSAVVVGTTPVEYVLGPKVASAGWYRSDGSLPYVNTLINYVPGEYRTYTLNTIIEAVPGNASTSFKVLADITSHIGPAPSIISDAFEWFNEVVDDPSFVPDNSTVTGLPRYVFRPSEHATRNTIESEPALKPAVTVRDVTEYRQALSKFANEQE